MRAHERFTILLSAVFLLEAGGHAQVNLNPATNLSVGTRPQWVSIADWNRDGSNDLAITVDGPDRVVFLLNTGRGTFGGPMSVLTGSGTGPAATATGDWNGDAVVDLAVTLKNTNSVLLLLNNGFGSFTQGNSYATGLGPEDLVAGDIDDDGDLDLLCICPDSNQVTRLENLGGGLMTATSFAVGLNPQGLALADLDGDGDLDLSVASHENRNIEVYESTGGVFVLSALLPTPGMRPAFVTAGDVDQDGDPDIATVADDFAVVFFNLGGLSFSTGANLSAGGLNPSSIVLSDLDVDGLRDIVVTNEDSNTLSTLENLGGMVFGVAVPLAVGTAPQHVATGDLDGNRSPDLVVANRDSDNISIVLNQNDGSRVAFAEVRNGTGVNPLCFSTPGPPVLGGSWTGLVDASGHPGVTSTVLFAYVGELDPGLLLAVGELLVDLTTPFAFSRSMISSGGLDSFVFSVPLNPALAGRTYASQALLLGGGAEFCNAIDLVAGYDGE